MKKKLLIWNKGGNGKFNYFIYSRIEKQFFFSEEKDEQELLVLTVQEDTDWTLEIPILLLGMKTCSLQMTGYIQREQKKQQVRN